MRLLPYEDFYIGTRLTYSQLSKRLQILTDTSSHLFEPFASRKKYYGQVTPDGFKVHHWVHIGGYWNPDVDPGSLASFPPIIVGDFLEATNGEIIIRMRLHPHWTAPLGLLHWLLIYGFIFVLPFLVLFTEVADARLYPEYALSMLAILIVLALLCTYGTMMAYFSRQSKQERDYFVKLTEAYEVVERY